MDNVRLGAHIYVVHGEIEFGGKLIHNETCVKTLYQRDDESEQEFLDRVDWHCEPPYRYSKIFKKARYV